MVLGLRTFLSSSLLGDGKKTQKYLVLGLGARRTFGNRAKGKSKKIQFI